MAATRSNTNASMCLETLESRQLMSVAVTNGVVVITGTDGPDFVEVAQDLTSLHVFENSILMKVIPTQQVTGIRFKGLGGNDKFTAFTGVRTPILAFGGAGNDTITGGGGNDVLLGEADNDSIIGGSGNDWIDGFAGDDTLVGGTGRDTIKGGNGDDRILARDNLRDVIDGGAGFDTAEIDKGLLPFFSTDLKTNVERIV